MNGALAWLLAAAVAQDPLVFSSGTDLVRVDVLVLDRGRPVSGLSAGDFEIRDDGSLQALEPLVEEELPVDATLVLDTSDSMRGTKLQALREAARGFVEGLRDDEQAALLDFRDEVRLLVRPTLDHARIEQALAGVAARGSTALRDGVYAGLRVREPGPRRAAVVVFSDGVDSISWLDPEAVVDAARRSDATVYAVAVRGRRDPEDSFLETVTRSTGGRLWTVDEPTDLRARFLEVLRDIRARYVLSFAPTSDRPGWHGLDVRLRSGKKLEIVARPSYWRSPQP